MWSHVATVSNHIQNKACIKKPIEEECSTLNAVIDEEGGRLPIVVRPMVEDREVGRFWLPPRMVLKASMEEAEARVIVLF